MVSILKRIFGFISLALIALLFLSCGEKKSEEQRKCEEKCLLNWEFCDAPHRLYGLKTESYARDSCWRKHEKCDERCERKYSKP